MDLSWNGFGSAYYAQALNADLLPYSFVDDRPDFTGFSRIGLNLSATVEERLTFAAQFVALGRPVGTSDSFGLLAQWGYVNYVPVSGVSLRFGRQLFPALLASEYVRVGYLLPFREIPALVFNLLPFTRFDGPSAYRTIETGAGRLTVGVFGGTPLLDVNATTTAASGLSFSFANLLGAQATLDGAGWRIRAQASRFFSELKTSAPLSASDQEGTEQNYSVGYRIDRSNFVSWGEYVFAQTPHGTRLASGGKFAERASGYYVLGGYRFGKWMPRYTFAKASESYHVLEDGEATSHTLGVNYQAGDQTVVKLEYERVRVPSSGGGYFVTRSPGGTATSGSAVYAGLDFIF
jgi:hypothetical protein